MRRSFRLVARERGRWNFLLAHPRAGEFQAEICRAVFVRVGETDRMQARLEMRARGHRLIRTRIRIDHVRIVQPQVHAVVGGRGEGVFAVGGDPDVQERIRVWSERLKEEDRG